MHKNSYQGTNIQKHNNTRIYVTRILSRHFYRVEQLSNTTPAQLLPVMLSNHIDSINTDVNIFDLTNRYRSNKNHSNNHWISTHLQYFLPAKEHMRKWFVKQYPDGEYWLKKFDAGLAAVHDKVDKEYKPYLDY